MARRGGVTSGDTELEASDLNILAFCFGVQGSNSVVGFVGCGLYIRGAALSGLFVPQPVSD